MRRVALTGGIATGKTYVLDRLRAGGIPTIDADEIVHEMLGPGTPATAAIAHEHGREFLRPDGGVDRARLGLKVFADADARRRVEAVLHPAVYEAIRRWFEALEGPVGVASIPLLYETGREKDFDFVVVTMCPPAVQLERLMDRDGVSEEHARLRIAAQMPAQEKAARADRVIFTGGTKRDTDVQVDELIAALRGGAQPHSL